MVEEKNVIIALNTKEKLFDTLKRVLSTKKRIETFIEIKPRLSQTEIAKKVGITQPAVSRTIDKLIELGLVEETEKGYRKTLTCLDHPLIEHLFRKEVSENGEE